MKTDSKKWLEGNFLNLIQVETSSCIKTLELLIIKAEMRKDVIISTMCWECCAGVRSKRIKADNIMMCLTQKTQRNTLTLQIRALYQVAGYKINI